jgi:hypothetical protein
MYIFGEQVLFRGVVLDRNYAVGGYVSTVLKLLVPERRVIIWQAFCSFSRVNIVRGVIVMIMMTIIMTRQRKTNTTPFQKKPTTSLNFFSDTKQTKHSRAEPEGKLESKTTD